MMIPQHLSSIGIPTVYHILTMTNPFEFSPLLQSDRLHAFAVSQHVAKQTEKYRVEHIQQRVII